jgi:hypothetical protein
LGERHLYYAPGYSLLIAPAFFLQSARPFAPIALIHWLLAVLFMAGLYRWSRRYFGRDALLLTALVLVTVGFGYYLRRIGPEIAFMAAMVWAVNFLTAAAEWKTFAPSACLALMGGLLVGGLCWIRPVGVFVAAGFGLMLLALARRRCISWTRCFVLGGAVSLVALASVVGLIVYERATASPTGPGSQTYVEQIINPTTSLPAQLAEGARLRVTEIGRLLIPGMFKSYDAKGRWLPNALFFYLPAFAFVAAGCWRFGRKAPNILAWTFPLYLGMYVIWPFEQGTRFMTPMLPVLWASVWFAASRWDRWRRPALVAVAGLHLILAGVYWANDIRGARAADKRWPALSALAKAVQSDDRNGAVCADREIAWMFFLALDRSWPIVPNAEAVKPGTRWLLIADERGEAPQFTTKARADDLRLLERVPLH